MFYKNNYIKFINSHKGENCFILASGPSLFFAMKNFIFKDIKKYSKIICVNSSILAENNPDYWISCDHLCVRWSWFNLVKNNNCTRIVRDSWVKYKDDTEGFYFFSPRKTPEDQIDFNEKRLMYCNSTNASIDFAIQCGFKNIFILGLDHKKIENKDHFWQFFHKKDQPKQIKPAQGQWEQQKSVFEIHLKSYNVLNEFANHKKVKIYNCNPDSKVEVFDKIDFKNSFDKILKR